ncbi:hypothetical protein KIH74_17490 [Kineosporia sp. J2-2]|uniref:Calcium-binding protein n=1 Tax=Kineosporia corallincola TaxID=2835133 RepID=A0ABS5TKN4_9ACTN|nr:calcium-binding protein [Kineosporia corallincola]MBT0770741.1 hypothetical protein [Kineosporia corallincola]
MTPHPARPLTMAVATVLGLAPLAAAGTARAAEPQATVSVAGHRVTYRAAPGQVNDVTASVSWNDAENTLIYLIDDSVRVKAGHGCTHPLSDDRTSVRCAVTPPGTPDPASVMSMVLGDRDDTVEFHNNTSQVFWFSEFWLGAGKDRLDSSDPSTDDGSFVWGQNGDDRITTGPVATVQGGGGADILTTNGGMSDLEGGQGDDMILAGVGPQFLRGGDGDDVIRGGGGRDVLYGGAGDDRLYGERGDDTLYGDGGDDQLHGGQGEDRLRGGPGQDRLRP